MRLTTTFCKAFFILYLFHCSSTLYAGCIYATGLNGSLTESGIMLSWSTKSEENNSFFIVERSFDGLKYEQAIQIEGAGNSIELNQYRFVDVSRGALRTFYRLIQVDYDGSMQFSEAIMIARPEKDRLFQITALQGMMTDRFFSVTLECTVDDKMEYRIMTQMGDVQEEGLSEVIAGTNVLSLDLSELVIGTYQFAIKVQGEVEVLNIQKVNSADLPDINLATKDSGN